MKQNYSSSILHRQIDTMRQIVAWRHETPTQWLYGTSLQYCDNTLGVLDGNRRNYCGMLSQRKSRSTKHSTSVRVSMQECGSPNEKPCLRIGGISFESPPPLDSWRIYDQRSTIFLKYCTIPLMFISQAFQRMFHYFGILERDGIY
jgi:hypothetical protein